MRIVLYLHNRGGRILPEQQNVQLPCNVIVRSQQKPSAVPHTYGGNYLSLLPSASHISYCGRASVFQRLFSPFPEFADYEKAGSICGFFCVEGVCVGKVGRWAKNN